VKASYKDKRTLVSHPPLKWWGGKWPLASRIHALAPPHTHRVHAFGGALGELWGWPHIGVSEVVNDLDLRLTNFWRVLQDPSCFRKFRRIVQAIPFSQLEWCERRHQLLPVFEPPDINQAVAFFVACRMSRAGCCDSFAPLSRTRTRRGMNEQASAWISAVDGLTAVHTRLRSVVVVRQDALTLIPHEDSKQTLFYLDPPYLPSTRSESQSFDFELSAEQHEQLLDLLLRVCGKVILSAYRSELYDQKLANWRVVQWDRANSAASGREKRRVTEVVYLNY
jgi:DNA adenine methylase